jgi:adenosylcobinamide kinase/adenosylcobinamide-phosphate guanylyltransferase
VRLRLLGTGSADGWPNPFCGCASCLRAAAAPRGQTAVLVEDDLLLDCGPEAPRAAVRQGASLAGVRHVLLTSAHPDHTGPAALLWRAWADRAEPLDVLGPPAAIALCRDWVGPADPVRLVEVTPGAVVRLGGYDVRALAGDHPDGAVRYDVTARHLGARLLYATHTGPLPPQALAAATGAAYDAVLLECTGAGPQHLDAATFPRQVAALRAVGAITPSTRVVAVHLGHRNPRDLVERMAEWGCEVLPDGAVLAGAAPVPPRLPPRRVLVLGGARSGKSAYAESRLAAEPAVTYVATGLVHGDPEWDRRVEAHRLRRPPQWRTVETTDVAALLRDPPDPAVLVDCLTLWLAPGRADVDALLAAWRATSAYVVAVSNEVGSGVVPATASGREFRDALGTLNARVAAESDEVWVVTAGIAQRIA